MTSYWALGVEHSTLLTQAGLNFVLDFMNLLMETSPNIL